MQDDTSESIGIDRVQDVFLQAVALPPHEQQECLDRLCGDDKELLHRVESLLKFDSPNEDPLEKGLTETLLSSCGLMSQVAEGLKVQCPHCHEAVDASDDTDWQKVTCGSCGSQFSLLPPESNTQYDDRSNQVLCDRFELQECVGKGAFARVYKAIDRELDRVVAIKIPLAGRLSEQAVERFLREARSAAQLRHPNIVAVHEVGRDGDTTYIVSDFIDGATLEQSMSQMQRSTTECIALVAKIASALEHAHQNGIIHRDLKPSNIMLNESGEPHLTDFGLAKQESADVTMTIDGQLIGTPAYMSPEQARGEGRTVDRRADIYALGAVLFELLTGERPFRGSTRMILHQLLVDDAPSPRQFNATVPRDVETICLKCLEKQPDQRYHTATDLIVDLDDFLGDRPIKSRPLGYAGRLARWAKRKPIVAALSLSLIMAMFLGTAVSTYFAFSARDEANKLTESLREEQRLTSEKTNLLNEKLSLIQKLERSNKEATTQANDKAAVLQFFQKHVLATTRPVGQNGGLGIDVTIRDAVDEAALRISEAFHDQPLVEAALRRTLADTYFSLGEYDKSIAQHKSAVHLFSEHKGQLHTDTLQATLSLIGAENAAGNANKALTLAEETRRTIENQFGAEHLLSLTASNVLGETYERLGRHHEAKALLESVFADLNNKWGPKHPATMSAMNHLASAYRRTGHIHEAVQLREKALSASEEKHGVDHTSTLSNLHNLAVAYSEAGRSNEAIRLYDRVIALKKKALGNDHPSTVHSMTNLSSLYVEAKRADDAIEVLREAQQSVRQSLGPDHPQSFRVTRTLAWAYHLDGKSQRSVDIMQPMIERAERKFGKENPETCQYFHDLAMFCESIGRDDDATAFRSPKLALAVKSERSNPSSERLPIALLLHGGNLMEQRRFKAAEPICRESMQRYADTTGKSWSHYHAMELWGECLLELDRFDESEAALLEAYQGLMDGIDHRPDYTPVKFDRVMRAIATLYHKIGKPEHAKKWEQELTDFGHAKHQAIQLRTQGRQAANVGNLKNALKFYDEAEELPWQRESHRRARIYARTLQWAKAKEAFQYAFPTLANWQELGLSYRLGEIHAYRSTRKDVLRDYRYVDYSWNYMNDLQMALLEPLDPENEIPVRFLAAVNRNHTDDPACVDLLAKSKYRLGEFDVWYRELAPDSPLRNGQELLIAINDFQQNPSSDHRQELQKQIRLHQQKAVVTLYRNVWESCWADYFDQVAWVREAQHVLHGTDAAQLLSSIFDWPDKGVDLIEASQQLDRLPRLGKDLIAQGKLSEAIKVYEELACIPGMTPDRQLANLYARTQQWESALQAARQMPGGLDWRIPLFLAQLGRDTECKIAAAEVLTNKNLRQDPSYEYRHVRVASLFTTTKEIRDDVISLAEINSPPRVTEKWRCAMVGLLMYRLGEFDEWYSALPTETPLRHNNELLVALTDFQRDANERNRLALQNEITKSENRIQRLCDLDDLGTKWPEFVCRSAITKDANEALKVAN